MSVASKLFGVDVARNQDIASKIIGVDAVWLENLPHQYKQKLSLDLLIINFTKKLSLNL